MKSLILLLALLPISLQNPRYRIDASGYGDNNPEEVQYAAKKSPRNKPVDYTSPGTSGPSSSKQGGKTTAYRPNDEAPAYSAILVPNNWIKNNIYAQALGQVNTQGQQNVQKGGDQTNAGVNSNQVNVGQSNQQGAGAGSYGPSYDAPTYTAIIFPRTNVIGNRIDAQTLGQGNYQGQLNVQQGGDQANVGSNANTLNVGQVNNQGVTGPSYDAGGRGRGNNKDDDKKGGSKSQPIIINNYIYVTQAANQAVSGTAAAPAPAPATSG
ncbi:hypothetical protein RB195_002933 [Necator americanus]|uniref:Uncharacterized protein n=1 Tax=Necator americanus TaxID=51031 RepID=A0ABR1DLI3_NECAM